MPNSADIPALIAAISAPRLHSYRVFFQPQTDEELLAIYRWHEDLCMHFTRILKWGEIVMRNRFHAGLSLHYGTRGPAGARDWYNQLRLEAHSHDSLRKITHSNNGRPRSPAPSPDDVVAKLTFGFWPKLLEAEQDTSGQPIPWGHILPTVVPGHRQTDASYWRPQANRDTLQARLELCPHLRNRIAHHEPIWKQGALLEETKPRRRRQPAVVEPAPRTPGEALNRLQLQHHRLMELLQWLSPDAARLVSQDPTFQQGQALLQAATLQAYRQGQR
jgi:Abi-like protein